MGKLFRLAMVLFVIGVGLTVTFLALSDQPVLNTIHEDSFEFQELHYDKDQFTEIEIEFFNRDYEVLRSADDRIHIEYYQTEFDIIEADDTTETLEIENKIKWYDRIFNGWNFTISRSFYIVRIYLPETETYDVSLETANGDIKVIDVDGIREFEAETSNGLISLNQFDANRIELKTSNGAIHLSDVTSSNTMNMRTSNGRITLFDVYSKSIDASTSNGKIIAEAISSESIELDSSNGDISLSIVGEKEDYKVVLETSNGDMLYDGIEVVQETFNPSGIYFIKLDTSNGDVSVNFMD